MLTIPEMPAHNHEFQGTVTTNGAGFGFSKWGYPGDTLGAISNTGNDQAHNNMQPTLFIGNLFIYAGA